MRLVGRMAVLGAGGVAAGLLAGAGVLATAGLARTGPATTARGPGLSGAVPADRDPGALIEATHLPPLLTVPGEPVTLRYDVYCAPPGPDPENGAPCDGAGTAYVRAGDSGRYRPLPLRLDRGASEGRYVAEVPADVAAAADGFSYYAVLRNRTNGATTTLPAGAAFAPMRSRSLGQPVVVRLGTHVFGAVRRPAARVASASWGTGAGQVGLEQGPELQAIGGSSFDVGPSGVVDLLDEANKRVLQFAPGRASSAAVPLVIRGTIADLAVGGDGGMTVLETVADRDSTPLLRRFDAAGELLSATHVAERSASSVQLGPDGPLVLGYPDGQWLPITDRGTSLGEAAQRVRGRMGRALGNGDELVVEREGSEARIAEIGARGVQRSWRIQSATRLGEIQLAKIVGDRLLLVLRVYTDARDEFQVLDLGDHGTADQFSVGSGAWAETAPLARFRVRGQSLYELGSTPAGAFVDRYDLEAR